MNCEEAHEILLNSLSGSIAADIELLLDDHIASCETCGRFAEVQRSLDARLTASVPVVSLSFGFRSSLRSRIDEYRLQPWPESLPDIAHLTGCALAIVLLLLVIPQYSRIVVLAGAGFAAVTYFLQAVLRGSLEQLDRMP